jgi:hypothetical protein
MGKRKSEMASNEWLKLTTKFILRNDDVIAFMKALKIATDVVLQSGMISLLHYCQALYETKRLLSWTLAPIWANLPPAYHVYSLMATSMRSSQFVGTS